MKEIKKKVTPKSNVHQNLQIITNRGGHKVCYFSAYSNLRECKVNLGSLFPNLRGAS